MTDQDKNLEVHKEEMELEEGSERTRARRVYIPRADIYETEDSIFVSADMPGVDENSVEIMLEKNELKITGYVDREAPEGYELAFAEYGVGDYQRKFMISNEIDRDKIEAKIKDGVLHLSLPKAEELKSRTISVKKA